MALSQGFEELRASRYNWENCSGLPSQANGIIDITRHLDCRQMTSTRAMYEVFSTEFKFPNYFSFNMDSFEECTKSVYLPENHGYCFEFQNSDYFLSSEDIETKSIFDQILSEMLEIWNAPEDLEKPWGRRPVVLFFHFT